MRCNSQLADVRTTDDALTVDLMDGRTISVPLAWFPRLMAATTAQQANWEACGGSYGIYWPDLDEDLNVERLLRGVTNQKLEIDAPSADL